MLTGPDCSRHQGDVDWRAGMPRDELFDASACRHHMTRYIEVEPQICGICIAACPLSRTD